MIPEFVDIGGPWHVLPSGVHDATLEEVEARLATSDRRGFLFSGFKDGAAALHRAGCRIILLDGSFVTAKPAPGDFDACWDPTGVNVGDLDPVFLNFADGRKEQKARFGGEFFPANWLADGTHFFYEYFQIDKHTGNRKGIICVRLHHT